MKHCLLVATVLAGAVPAHAQQRPIAYDRIVEAVKVCAAAAKVGRIDEAVLVGAGWKPASLSSDSGPVQTPLRFYGRLGNDAVIVFAAEGKGAGLCNVTGRVKSGKVVQQVADALLRAFPGHVGRRNGEYVYLRGSQIILLSPTGSRQSPGVRIGVNTHSSGDQ